MNERLVSGIEQRLSSLEAAFKRHERILSQNLSSYEALNPSLDGDTRDTAQESGQGCVASSLDEHDGIQLEASGVQEIVVEGVSDGMAVTLLDEEDSSYFGMTLPLPSAQDIRW